MRPRPKLRTFCRWMLTILTVMLVVVWIGSWFYYAFVVIPYWRVSETSNAAQMSVWEGRFEFWTNNFVWTESRFGIARWGFARYGPTRFNLWDWGLYSNGPFKMATFPAWLPALLIAIPTAFIWRHEILSRRGITCICMKCGYDIAGLVGQEACPECGTVFPAEISKAAG